MKITTEVVTTLCYSTIKLLNEQHNKRLKLLLRFGIPQLNYGRSVKFRPAS